MKLLFLLSSNARGGVEEYILRIANSLIQDGWEVHVAMPFSERNLSLRNDFKSISLNIHHTNISDHFYGGFRGNVLTFYKILRTVFLIWKVRPNFVQVIVPFPHYNNFSIIACALVGVRTLVRFALIISPSKCSSMQARIYKWALSKGQKWYAVSDQNRKLIAQSYSIPSEMLDVIYNGTYLPQYRNHDIQKNRISVRKEIGLPFNSRIVLTVARLSPLKGFYDLLHAIPYIFEKHPDVYFMWAGDDWDICKSECENLCEEYGIQDRLYLLGYRSDVSRLLFAADLFILPTHGEGCSNSLLEAMAHGTPIVASDASSMPEIIKDNVHGRLFRSGDSCNLLSVLSWALEHSEEMKAMGRMARSRVKNRFRIENMIRNTTSLLIGQQ